jgi:shikimate kinase
MERKGITLIGMPASGKSTIGKELAKRLSFPLLDVDRWMEQQNGGVPLAEIIETKGADYTLNMETDCIRRHNLHETIVSTPGSIIYNDVLEPLQEQTHIVWLNVPADTIEQRLRDDTARTRLIIGLKEKGFAKLLIERMPLYEQWARYTVDCDGKSALDITAEIINHID